MARIIAAPELCSTRPRVSLDGRWQFCYDPQTRGVAERWFDPAVELPERTRVPGCPQARAYASAKSREGEAYAGLPETKTAILLRHGCTHPAWFKREFHLPHGWRQRHVWLHVGAVKPAADFWINGVHLGRTTTSRSPVRIDLTGLAHFEGANTLTVRVDWPEQRLDGLFDALTAFSGIYRSVWVEAVEPAHIVDVDVWATIDPLGATLVAALRGRRGAVCGTGLRCEIRGEKGERWKEIAASGKSGDLTWVKIPMPGAALWSPDAPNLYRAHVRLMRGQNVADEVSVRFGLREVRTRGNQVLLNGRPIFLRGGCDDQLYPETVCPPADKAYFARRIAQAKRFGFNYTKSCVEVFTPEFLEAADEQGYLVCQEMPFGLVGEPRKRRFDPPAWFARMCHRELGNIVTADRNHPSVVFYSMASELGTSWLDNAASFRLFSRELPAVTRRLNRGALVFDVTGGHTDPDPGKQAIPLQTRAGRRDTDLDGSWLLWGQCGAPFDGPLTGLDRVTLPYFLHEWAWITGLTKPEVAKRFARLPIVPLHIADMVRAARKNGQAGELKRMIAASWQLKYAFLKYCLELGRRHPRVAGYHQWLIHDFPFCAEGVLDEFWNPPAEVSAEEFRACNGDTVVLLDDHSQRCFEAGVRAKLGLTVSHFGPEPLKKATLRWRLCDGRKLVAEGERRLGWVKRGGLVSVNDLGLRLPPSRKALVLQLQADLTIEWHGQRSHSCGAVGRVFDPATDAQSHGRLDARTRYSGGAGRATHATNTWKIWAMPAAVGARVLPGVVTTSPLLARELPATGCKDCNPVPPGARVLITHTLADPVLDFLAAGGRVLLLSAGTPQCTPTGDLPKCDGGLYRSVPYNTGTTGNMGTLIRDHPALGGLAHEGWCDLVFSPLIQGAYPIALAPFGVGAVRPIIRSIGHMRTMEDKAYLFEVGVGRGCLLATSLRLELAWRQSPLARHLLRGMLGYLVGGRVRPGLRIRPERLRAIRVQAIA